MTSKVRPASFLFILILSLTITLFLGDGTTPTQALAEGGWGGCIGDTCPPDTTVIGQRIFAPSIFDEAWIKIIKLF